MVQRSDFSKPAQQWLDDTLVCLKQGLIPDAENDAEDESCTQISSNALNSHVKCFVEHGFCSLAFSMHNPFQDAQFLKSLMRVYDVEDLESLISIEHVHRTIQECGWSAIEIQSHKCFDHILRSIQDNNKLELSLPEDFFLYDHPDYLEDEFTENDWFVWPAGHTDYADLTVNRDPEWDDPNASQDESSEDENPEGKQLDIIDPVHHPVHFFPDRPKRPEYTTIDPLHHKDKRPDDGPARPSEADALSFSHYYDGEPVHRELIPDHIYYTPINPSEHHALHVDYDIYPEEYDFDAAVNPLHPLDPNKHAQIHHSIGTIEPIKKYVDYYGTHYLV